LAPLKHAAESRTRPTDGAGGILADVARGADPRHWLPHLATGGAGPLSTATREAPRPWRRRRRWQRRRRLPKGTVVGRLRLLARGVGGSTGRVEVVRKATSVGCAAPVCVQAPRPRAPAVTGATAATRVDVATDPSHPRRTAAPTAHHEPTWLIPSPAGDGHGHRNEQLAAPVAAAVPPTSARRRHAGTGVGTAASTRAGVGPISHPRLRAPSMPAAQRCPQSCQQPRPRRPLSRGDVGSGRPGLRVAAEAAAGQGGHARVAPLGIRPQSVSTNGSKHPNA